MSDPNPILAAMDKMIAEAMEQPYKPPVILCSRDTIVPVAEHIYGKDSPEVAQAEAQRADLLRVQFKPVPR